MMGEAVQDVSVGGISELKGNAQVVRDKPYDASLDFAIQQNDKAVTKNGRLGITFLDDSQVRLTENSSLTVTKYVFNPDPNKSELGLNFTLGTARFVTGKFNKIAKQNIKLSTPTAEIAVLGTDFTCTIDELGRSLIILLPGSDGLASGEIEVTTAIGTVKLTKPYEATTVSVWESAPSKSVILDLTVDAIDNMLIITPPKEEVLVQEEQLIQTADYLDFNELDVDYLAEDFLAEDPDFDFTELDINYLDVNFLEDLLDILDTLALIEEEDQLANVQSTAVSGTAIGQDPATQITTILDGEVITLIRQVTNTVRLDLNSSNSYTVILVQDGVSKTVKINGGSSSTITIRQSSG